MRSSRGRTQPEISVSVAVLLALALAVPGACISIWLIASGLDKKSTSEPLKGDVRTTGVVASVNVIETLHGGEVYSAEVEFTAVDGKKYKVTSKSGDERPRPGDAVEVSYNPKSPSDAREVSTNVSSWKAPVATGAAVAVVEVAGSAFLVAWAIRSRRRASSEASVRDAGTAGN